MIRINFEILGKEWSLRVLKRKKYNKKNGSDSLAITYDWKRRIDVGSLALSHETLCHELVHAYLSEMCVSSVTELTVADLEEIYAELMSKRGRELLDLADNLLAQINKTLEAKITYVRKTD